MKILCQERYDKAVAYAKEIKNDTLQKCIDRLKQWEENPNCPCEIELYYDSAPHSFGFRQVYPDGRTGIVGGLLYHGQPDQSFAVLMNPIHGWTIHTYKQVIPKKVKANLGLSSAGLSWLFVLLNLR